MNNLIGMFFDFNSVLWYSILFTIIFVVLVFLDRMLYNLIPNFIVGFSGLLALGSWIYYFLNNFIKNYWNTSATAKAIIIAVSFIILALFITGIFGRKKSNLAQVGNVINPEKIGKHIKGMRK